MLTLNLTQLSLNELKLLFALLWPSGVDMTAITTAMVDLRRRMGSAEAERFFDTVENEVLVRNQP